MLQLGWADLELAAVSFFFPWSFCRFESLIKVIYPWNQGEASGLRKFLVYFIEAAV